MPYNEAIDERIQTIVRRWKNTDTRKMFGGVCHLLDGNMFCGVYKDSLILRLGEETAEETLGEAFARPFDITGRPMKGWVMMESKGFASDEALRFWLEKAKAFGNTLPAK